MEAPGDRRIPASAWRHCRDAAARLGLKVVLDVLLVARRDRLARSVWEVVGIERHILGVGLASAAVLVGTAAVAVAGVAYLLWLASGAVEP